VDDLVIRNDHLIDPARNLDEKIPSTVLNESMKAAVPAAQGLAAAASHFAETGKRAGRPNSVPVRGVAPRPATAPPRQRRRTRLIMKRLLAGVAVLTLGLGGASTVHAQPIIKNKVINSANGAGNNVVISNGGGGFYGGGPAFGGYPAGYGGSGGYPSGYGNGGYGPSMYYQPSYGYPGGYGGGYNLNKIYNSANGQGNSIAIQNGGNYGYYWPGGNYGGINVGGVNVNVITNSGNGVGNSIGIMNR
jgi:hypothetical protein